MRNELVGIIGQWLACFLIGLGIGIEVAYGAHVGFCLITAGSLVCALATKIKYHRSK